jgi:hypothetical protein
MESEGFPAISRGARPPRADDTPGNLLATGHPGDEQSAEYFQMRLVPTSSPNAR